MNQPADDHPLLVIPLPGGRVARVPLSVLDQYVDPKAKAAHDPVNLQNQEVEAQEMVADPHTGQMYWHTDFEQGQCTYTDDAGFPRTGYHWHRHPLGNSYTEIMQ